MDEDALNLSIRKFLKMVGIHSQREIEQAVARMLADKGTGVADSGSFPAKMSLRVPGLGIDVTYDGEIRLQ